MNIRIEKLEEMNAAYFYALSDTPEEDAGIKVTEWAKLKGLMKKGAARLFGRNTYPTDNPEPHGYEFYLTVGSSVKLEKNIELEKIPSGLYAVLRFKNLEKIHDAWKKLWKWIDQSEYEYAGWKKGKNGWVNGFEEHINWYEQKSPVDWIFDLWVQLKE